MTKNSDRRMVPKNQPVPVKVSFDNGKGDKVEYYMNLNNPMSMKKLIKSLHWAILNGRTVTMVEDTLDNAKDYYDKKHGTAKGELLEQMEGDLVG